MFHCISAIFRDTKLLQELNQKWEELFPITLEYINEPQTKKKVITEKVREFYLNNENLCEKTMRNLSNVSVSTQNLQTNIVLK